MSGRSDSQEARDFVPEYGKADILRTEKDHITSLSAYGLLELPKRLLLVSENQDDDEIVLQIVFLINCLFSHPSICAGLCGEESEVVEYLINLMHDKNPQLRAVCDQALQLVAVSIVSSIKILKLRNSTFPSKRINSLINFYFKHRICAEEKQDGNRNTNPK